MSRLPRPAPPRGAPIQRDFFGNVGGAIADGSHAPLPTYASRVVPASVPPLVPTLPRFLSPRSSAHAAAWLDPARERSVRIPEHARQISPFDETRPSMLSGGPSVVPPRALVGSSDGQSLRRKSTVAEVPRANSHPPPARPSRRWSGMPLLVTVPVPPSWLLLSPVCRQRTSRPASHWLIRPRTSTRKTFPSPLSES